MNTIELEIEVNNEPVNVTVDYQYYPSDPGLYAYSNGDPGYPPTGPEVDILSVQDENGATVPDDKITAKWCDLIIEKCLDDAENNNTWA